MESMESLKAKQAKELAKLETEHAIAALCPLPPKRVMEVSTGERAWITYDVASLWGALDVMAAFQPLAFARFKGTYVRYEPAAINDKRVKDKGEEQDGPYVAKLDVTGGESYGPAVVFSFFALVGDDICKIRCDFGYNRGHAYGASFQRNDRGSKRMLMDGRRYVYGEFSPNSRIYAAAESFTNWASGSAEPYNHTYAFGADYMCDDSGVAGYDLDAIYRLENLALLMHRERASCIAKEESAPNGRRLTMEDGSVWFHPYGGEAPVCETAAKK